MSNKNKHLRGVVYYTNPQYQYEMEEERDEKTPSNQQQQLRVRIEKQHRGGKTVTVIDGFIGRDEDREQLGKTLKQKCGTGGSVKDGLILLQGDMKERIIKLLNDLGYKAK
jgi:translation initiation factor 1